MPYLVIANYFVYKVTPPMSKIEKKPKDRGDTFSEHVSLARDPPPLKRGENAY